MKLYRIKNETTIFEYGPMRLFASKDMADKWRVNYNTPVDEAIEEVFLFDKPELEKLQQEILDNASFVKPHIFDIIDESE